MGRVADGWLPSLRYVGGVRGITEGNVIDGAAEAAQDATHEQCDGSSTWVR